MNKRPLNNTDKIHEPIQNTNVFQMLSTQEKPKPKRLNQSHKTYL